MNRAHAFARVRDVAGAEVCGTLGTVARTVDPDSARIISKATTTAHNLRHLVVALLVTRDGSPCPFCPGPCNERCHLRRVLA